MTQDALKRCGIVVLAAGASARMGVAKQTLEFRGSTLLRRAVDTATASICKPVVVVLGAGADACISLLQGLSVSVVVNDKWERGMGTSIRRGIESIRHANVDAVMILLCDQPLIETEALNRMVESYFASGRTMAAASYAGALGTPAIFASLLFEQLLNLHDSQGGKVLLHRYPDQVHSFAMPEAEVDLDTTDDFKRLS